MTITELHQQFLKSTGVSIDTRKIQEGSIYFALKGENFNGNAFAQKALNSGATLAVIDEEHHFSENCLLVEDSLSTLQELAKFHREQLSIPIIGLTGSNGKTTTKELIYQTLSVKFNTLATAGNFNNHIGVPLTLLSITDKHEMAVIEMGANHQREIEFLCTMAQPDYGYITNFGRAHLEGFGGPGGVIRGKSELYDYLRANGKKALVNANDPIQLEKTVDLERLLFCSNEKSPSIMCDYHFHTNKEEYSKYVSAKYNGELIQSQLTGAYNFGNMVAAISLGLHFGISISDIKTAIEAYTPSNNRSQVTETDKNTLIVDAYNANPSSVEQAILNLKQFPGKDKWVVLGDMFEMGEFELEEHQKVVDLLNKSEWDAVFLVGKAFGKCKSRFQHFESTEDLMTKLKELGVEDKTILIKGSRGMKLERIIPLL